MYSVWSAEGRAERLCKLRRHRMPGPIDLGDRPLDVVADAADRADLVLDQQVACAWITVVGGPDRARVRNRQSIQLAHVGLVDVAVDSHAGPQGAIRRA